MHGLEVLSLERLRRVRESVFDGAENKCERRAELVRDVAEERCLGAVDLGQRLSPLLLCLVRASVGDDVRHLIRGSPKEPLVPLVEGTVWADASNQERIGC